MWLNYVRIGILVLFAAFSVAFLSSFLVLGNYRDSFHIVTTLAGSADVFSSFSSHITLYGIAPVVACLSASLLAFGLERKFPSDDSFSIAFFFLAMPSVFWGIVCLFGTFYAYSDSMRLATSQYSSVSSHLPPLYELLGSVGVMWLTTGIVLIVLARKSEAI